MDDIHPFYADLLNVLYDRDHYKLALGQLNVARNLIDKVAQGLSDPSPESRPGVLWSSRSTMQGALPRCSCDESCHCSSKETCSCEHSCLAHALL